MSRAAAAGCGILGPACLLVYFAAPAVTGWPYAGASPDKLIAYSTAHSWLFYAGAWFQVTGTLLSLLFYLALLSAAKAQGTFWGNVLLVTAGSLLAVVLVEAALLVAVPIASEAGDKATVATSFALSNGVFARVFPLAPASGTYVALGVVLLRAGVLPKLFASTAIALGVAFEIAGVLAIISSIGLFVSIVLSVIQVVWVAAAALSYGFMPRGRA